RSTRRRSSAKSTGCCAGARAARIRSLPGRRSATGIFHSGDRFFPASAARAMSEAPTKRRHHVADSRANLYDATRRSLQGDVKSLPAIWLYDDKGSQLYERITGLPEYYLPRRESEILHEHVNEIAARTHARALVELGAGTAKNIRLLLDALDKSRTLEWFVPLDVSEQTLRTSA